MVMAQSLFINLKKAMPGCQIDVLAPAWSLPMLDRMPEVAKTIALPLTHGQFALLERIHIGRQLQSAQYDQAIVLPNSWKSAVIPFMAKIPKRTGFLGEVRWGLLNDIRRLDKATLTMTVQRFVALGLPGDSPQAPEFQQPRLPANRASQQAAIEKFALTITPKTLVLCPGAEYGPSKRWPATHFAEVAKAKIQQGWQVWLLGSEKDQAEAKTISAANKHGCLDFVGKTTLTEAIDLISLANTVVANDSGLMHLAAALDKKVIAIYGSTPPEFAPPLSTKAHSVTLNLSCSPCRQRICPLYPVTDPNHTKCLTAITPEQIAQLIG